MKNGAGFSISNHKKLKNMVGSGNQRRVIIAHRRKIRDEMEICVCFRTNNYVFYYFFSLITREILAFLW